MCGRFTLKAPPDALTRLLGAPPPQGYRPRYNVAPTQQVLGLVAEDGRPEPRFLRWGLIPFWADDPAIGNRMINARAETVAEKPAYRNALARRRCLVVADGFYEWQKRPDGKHPMRIQLRSGEPFFFAGLWERWDRHGDPLETCTILTTAANPLVHPIHERMPVILPRPAADRWLDPAADRDGLLSLLRPYEGADLEAYEVSTLVNSPSNDRPECIVPLDPPLPAPPGAA